MVFLVLTFIAEAAIFALYIFVCLALVKPRFSLVSRVLVYGGVLLCSCGAVTALSLFGNSAAALTLLPLIAYLPFSICVYLLSEGGILETSAACSMGALVALTVKLVKKILPWLYSSLPGTVIDIAVVLTVLILASGAGYVVFRFVRESFRACVSMTAKNRALILVPAVTLSLMIFINFNSTSSVAVLVMTLMIAVSFFAIASRVFVDSARIAEADENERKLAESLELQRKSFERLSQSVDAWRYYRHDMRHHLKVLSGMARQNNSEKIVSYIENLNKNAELSAPGTFCKNPAINAVLSEYISRAEKLGCRTELKISVPEELPFELSDVCIILSNALENALNACEKCPGDIRYIDLLTDYSDDCKLKISVKNSCAAPVKLDASGLPITEAGTDGHGIGLRGVKKTVEKYNGFVCCACENGEFHFFTEIFRAPNSGVKKENAYGQSRERSKALPAVLTSIVCAVGLLNFSPASASALSEVLSVNIKTFGYGWGDNGFSVRYPEFGGENSDVLNQNARDFIAEAEEIFREYALQKYEGYTALDAGYRVYANDRTYLSARFFATLNVGGSMEFSRCVNIDKRSGEVFVLADLFDENYDYIAEISAEVLRQMEFRVEYQKANYFIPGGIWTDDECFKEISPEQDFYINTYGQLVIVFEEYAVAPGSEGSPEFVMPEEIFKRSSGD